MSNIIEVHRNGINAHNKVVTYYVLDYQTKQVEADLIRREDVAFWLAEFFGQHYYGEDYGVIRMW